MSSVLEGCCGNQTLSVVCGRGTPNIFGSTRNLRRDEIANALAKSKLASEGDHPMNHCNSHYLLCLVEGTTESSLGWDKSGQCTQVYFGGVSGIPSCHLKLELPQSLGMHSSACRTS
jgi:hypothetical protein